MIRIVLENVFFFLLPTVVYVAYVAFKSNTWPGLGKVLHDGPLVRLLVLGAALMVTTLIAFSSSTGHKPGESYTPPAYRDGKLEPGNGGAKPQ